MTADLPALELRNVVKTYGPSRAVDGISLRVERGEFVTLLGPSGCGKTSLLNMVAGFFPPTSGRILIEGEDVTDVPSYLRDVGVVFQNYALFPHMTVAQNVAFGLQERRVKRAEIGRRVAQALDMVKLADFGARRPAQLSGGQQQRVALARALLIEPRLLLLDEPLSALDKNLRTQMQIEIKQIQRQTGITALFVTHDQGEALSLSDRIAVLNHGRIEQIGTAREIYCMPSSGYVASFVGDVNRFAGQVRAISTAEMIIDLGHGTLLHAPPGRGEFTQGSGVDVFVRPEDIALGRPQPGAANMLQGSVVAHSYQGSFTHVVVDLPGREPADGAFEQAGILRPTSLEEGWALAEALTRAPAMVLGTVAVASDGGGHATLGCDALERAGLQVSVFSAGLQSALLELLPPRCPVANPLDYAGFAEEKPLVVADTIDLCLSDPAIGGVLLTGHFGGYHRLAGDAVTIDENAVARRLGEAARAHAKPVVVHSVYADDAEPAISIMRDGGVPVLRGLDLAAAVLSGLHRWSGYRTLPVTISSPAQVSSLAGLPSGIVPEPAVRALLATRGLPVPASVLATTAASCCEAATHCGVPVALKIVSPAVIHKSDVGGVLLNVSAPEAAEGFSRLRRVGAAAGDNDATVLVTPMVAAGTELVLGAIRDPSFGPVVMLGFGGVLVEVTRDVVFRMAPITLDEAGDMIRSLRSAVLLTGYRNRPPVDLPALASALVTLSTLIADTSDIAEIDINPMIATKAGLAVVDARLLIARSAPV